MFFNNFVELDNGTERIQSDKDTDSWQRKVRLYEQFQDQTQPHRFRVLVLTTRSSGSARSRNEGAATAGVAPP